MLSVGAHHNNDVIWHRSGGGVVSWANTSSLGGRVVHVPDVAAPGAAIIGASPNNSYRMESGTSMATPQVAGMAALVIQMIRSEGATISPSSLKKLITKSVLDRGQPGRDERFGEGLLSGELLYRNTQNYLISIND